MKIDLKNQKGITMITITIAIIILVLVTNILIYNAKDGVYAKKLENMYNDVESLRDKLVEYYVQYGAIPAYTNAEYSLVGKNDLSENWISQEEKTKGKFYVIDLKALDGVTLNYGRDYEKVSNNMTTEEISKFDDIYIVNSVSQNVFYVKGISTKNKKYYSDREKDETVIDLKYEEGWNIPTIFEVETETKEIKMTQGSESFNINLKNYNDEEFNIMDVEYGIRLKDSSKFKIEVEDERDGVLAGGLKSRNNVDIVVTSVPYVELEDTEQIIIQVIQTKPNEKTVEIPVNITLPKLAKGYMNDFRRVRLSDVQNNPNEEVFNDLYGDNEGHFEYDGEGSIILDENNTIPVFDRSERNYSNGYTLYITVKGNTDQDPNDAWGPSTIFGMSDDQDGSDTQNRLCLIGFRKNMLHVYSYYNEEPVQNCNTEYEGDGFISKDISAYSNKKMNIQITGVNDGNTNVYINGELFHSFNSGTGTGSFNQAIIGDLRPQRGAKFLGNFYDVAVYNRVLSNDEIQGNWEYARNNWNIY